MKHKIKLTKRDYDVMDVLWNHTEPLSAKEIQKEVPGLPDNSVHLILKRLMEKEYVYVANISQRHRKLMREFLPSISREQYVASLMDKKSLMQLSASFIRQCSDMEMIERLQQEIDKKKRG